MSKWPKPSNEKKRNGVRLSPLARLYLTLDHELQLDETFRVDNQRYKTLLEMFKLSEQKRDNLLRSFLLLDAVAAILLFGKSINIPGLGISLNDIPAAREIVIFFSSLAFQFAATSFLNWNGYAAMIDTINLHRSRRTGIDPDWLSAGDKFMEFAAKLYRPRMKIYGPDVLLPGRGYRIVARLVSGLTLMTMLTLLLLHLAVATVSIRQTALSLPSGFFNLMLVCIYTTCVGAANLGGILVFFTMGRSFTFFSDDSVDGL